MSASHELLFVYGTLLSGDTGATGRAQRARLAREARLIGTGFACGRLYDLGRYPGLVLTAGAADRVHGELLELANPTATLRWLDAYEGIVPGEHPHNEYERLRLPVTRDSGETVDAWLYIYRGPLTTARVIPEGRWLVV